jgi:choline dehydrogenase-like flavoprotein
VNISGYIVVGSGCSAAMAAQTLVEAGADVTMVDVGVDNPEYHSQVPEKDYIDIRRNELDQHRYLIGQNAEGVAWGHVGKGAQITPPRQHMIEKVDTYLPVRSSTFSPVESLGYGGLGIGWGLQCWEFSDADIKAVGLDETRMRAAYEVVAQRVGISATKDDASPYTIVDLKTYQPPVNMDRNHQRIHNRYQAYKDYFIKRGFVLGRTPLALLTEDMGAREKYAYRDMDYYTDNGQSAWRPWITVNQLKEAPNFAYIGGHLVTRFVERDGFVEVECLTIPQHEKRTLRCRTLVLAAGALGSARIALRSTGRPHTKLPLLCNPYSFIPCVQLAMVGKEVERKKLGLAQLSLILDEEKSKSGFSIASLYSYQSLMLFRLMGQVPFLGFSDARPIMRYLMSGLVIMGVHHPDKRTPRKYVQLVSDANSPVGDHLGASYVLDKAEQDEFARREKKYVAAGRRLGIYATKRINPGYGASIHYAGTLPFSHRDKSLTLSPSGRLHGTQNIYVADSSGFNYLPACGLTFSLLANAHITAQKALKHEP